ncbi:putative transporter -like protein [Emericellopsis cladophorae]|uniref:Transporter -like protein n=1 Tax=Emericellopsis cladophorae TaxID=2686198 RepID=A0A9P9XVN0_9HYPO|nr:putative transporter -like protein [Emericellopsis cladophorae]KAI6778275.1 putative transporter -like protein [Emericellopsis cladophorae]
MAPASMDETEPLLGLTATLSNSLPATETAVHAHEDLPLDFDPSGDPDNPREWPSPFKWSITLLLTALAFTVTFNCISVVPIANRIVSDLAPDGRPDKYASVLLVTIWELGEAAGPLLIAPLSEIVGRWPVMNVANTLFVLTTLLAASAPTVPLLIMARALSGLVVVSNVLNPAIVGDIFDPDHRGSPLSLVALAPLLGGAAGPAIGGAIAETLGWRWVLYMAAIFVGVCQVLFLTCFRETYKVAILRRRARHRQAMDAEGAPNREKKGKRGALVESIVRPFIVFGSSGVLMALSLFGSVVFSHFYSFAVTLPDIFEDRYHLSPAVTGGSMVCFSIGSAASVMVCNVTLDRIYVRMKAANNGVGQPEFRLPMVIVGGFALPVMVAAYGWAAELRVPLWVLLVLMGLVGFALMLAFVPVSAYVVDAFGLYAASAMTGLIVARCLMGTFLPLATTPLVRNYGFGWGFTILGAVSLGLAPIPVLVFRYGERWRQLSRYTRSS